MTRGLVVAMALLPWACALARSNPAPAALDAEAVARAQQRWPEVDGDSLERGRALFASSCNGCHGYPAPADHSERRWPRVLRDMGPRANLSRAEADLVLRFVLAARLAEMADVPSDPSGDAPAAAPAPEEP